MKPCRHWIALLLLAAVLAGGTLSAQSSPETPLIERVRWLTGCWEGTLSGGRTYEEVWLPPRGKTMVGLSRTVRDDRTIGHEWLLIFEEEGRLVYYAHPSGQQPTRFTAVEITDSTAVFANPEHDFPQRIRYQLLGTDSLLARIEGERGGELRTVDFPMRRSACGQ